MNLQQEMQEFADLLNDLLRRFARLQAEVARQVGEGLPSETVPEAVTLAIVPQGDPPPAATPTNNGPVPDGAGPPATANGGESFLQNFLRRRQVAIAEIPDLGEADDVLDNLARLLGDNFEVCRTFYRRLKSTLSDSRGLRLDLKGRPGAEINFNVQFATRLHKIGFLADCHYRKAPVSELYVKVSRLPAALNFLSGGWLERYLRVRVVTLLRRGRSGRPCEVLAGVKVVLPGGADAEFDLLCAIGGEVFLFEAKTGAFQKHLDKYLRLARVLGLDRDHCLLILTDATDEDCRRLSEVNGLWVVPLRQLAQVLEERLPVVLPLPAARPPQGSSGWAVAATGEQEGRECV
jgi:hypothetical protein